MLDNNGTTRDTIGTSRTKGFAARGQTPVPGAIVVQVPETLSGAEQSVCGLKAFLIDERRVFSVAGQAVTVDCARVAVLDITDSPVHVHGETVETYHILQGQGRMVLGGKSRPVGPGDFIFLPPGVPHGLVAEDPAKPVRVLMTFSPGMAPVKEQRFRDEKIVHPSAGQWLSEKERAE